MVMIVIMVSIVLMIMMVKMFLVVVVMNNLQKAELQSECSLQAESSV